MTAPLAVVVALAAVLLNLALFGYLSDLTGENLISVGLRRRVFIIFLTASVVYLVIAALNAAGVITLRVEFEDPYDHGKLWFLNLGEKLSFAAVYGGAALGLIFSFISKGRRERSRRFLGFAAFVAAVLDIGLLMGFFYF